MRRTDAITSGLRHSQLSLALRCVGLSKRHAVYTKGNRNDFCKLLILLERFNLLILADIANSLCLLTKMQDK